MIVLKIIQKKLFLLELIILALTVQWLLGFFGQSLIPAVLSTGGFIYMLAVVIVVLILMKFLSFDALGMAPMPLFFLTFIIVFSKSINLRRSVNSK